MLIVSKIRRTGGTRVTIDGKDYEFKPTDQSGEKHVCDVEDEAAIQRLLSVPEGFEAMHPGEAVDFTPTPKPTPEDRLEADIDPNAEEPVEAGKDDAEATLEADIEPDNSDGLNDLTDLDLSHAYKDVFGKAPHGRMKRETIITEIRKALAEA